ncbi:MULTISPECIES: YdcF family protein [unclassified Wenzhouxiangella]|uniref:YdcF family protein n=1 Tax=unclassified Wenzhouxiangella TaxID=2613841 RepID=UPI000E32A82F|nr:MULTISPECIES: YdcF family protein [unclassified Wenzhouxiangella]RFF27855.1 YdcF family protein [Wenzhouxiangella sp. 15181]RFP69018.1 YdcF family protein [Wenzhouxiangella sp. 15190]
MLYLDKVLAQLAYPLGLAIALVLAGLALVGFRRARMGLALALAGLGWLTLWSLPAVSDHIRASLEQRYENLPAEAAPEVDAIVLLGGGERGTPKDWPYPDLARGADRIWHAARLYHAGKAPKIIVSGGRVGWTGDRQTGAEAMRELLTNLGVPGSAILMETESRNTRENAVNTAAIAKQNDIEQVLLVTSALHMRRSLATFNAAGLEAVPAAADFEVMPEPSHVLRWLPDAEALHDSTRAIKEYLGYWVYRWRGWAE